MIVSYEGASHEAPLSLLALRMAPGLERKTVTIAPGDWLPEHITCWKGAIVSVEAGTIEMTTPEGELLRLCTGALLLLDGVEQVAVRNVGDVPVVLAAIRRRDP